ncbi:MAG: hypothetical protein PHR81_11290 [Bacteroidales bacterium]|jgi:hypothetical protein|nr:hypothetical protein [Bacteroidales bacterium]MDD4215382.1 hypothetical protein [Bacteroidales bacterium]
MQKSCSILLFFVLFAFSGLAQENIPLQRDINFALDKYLNHKDAEVFTALKPYNNSFVGQYILTDSALTPGCKKAGDNERWFKRKIFREDLFVVNHEDFHLYVSPLFNFGYGYSFNDTRSLYYNTRGVQIRGVISNKLFFISKYYETQARFPDYVSNFIEKYEVAPGSGRVKEFKARGYDFGTPVGLISYSPDSHWNLQFGFDKNFIGDGYRSLLLSDNTFQYPFLKVFVNYKWFYYQTIFASFQNLNTDSVLNAPYVWYHGYQTKPATFNFAGFRIGKKVELGLFEGIMFTSSAKNTKFNFCSLIPVILVNTIQYSLNNKNNALLGITAKYKPLNTLGFYGQLMVDNLKLKKLFTKGYQGNNWGFQIGGKWFGMFGLQNLNMQVEYNQVSPYSYSHFYPLQSYTHYNQSLTHPLGANFRELTGFINYRYRRIFAEAQFNYAVAGLDTTNTNWGQDVFLSQVSAQYGYQADGNKTAQGINTEILNAGVRAYYLFNPKTNLLFEVGYNARYIKNDYKEKLTHYFYFGLKTSLTNIYHDF